MAYFISVIDPTAIAFLDAEQINFGSSPIVEPRMGDYDLTAEDNGKVLLFTNAALANVSLPADLAVGFSVTVIQTGAMVRFVPASGAQLHHFQGHNATLAVDAMAGLLVRAPGAYQLSGATAAA